VFRVQLLCRTCEALKDSHEGFCVPGPSRTRLEDSAEGSSRRVALPQHPLVTAMANAASPGERRRLWEEYASDQGNFANLTACAVAVSLQRMRRLLLMVSFCANEVTPLGLGMSRGRARKNTRRRNRRGSAAGDGEQGQASRSARARQTLQNIRSRASSRREGNPIQVDLDVDFEGEVAKNINSRIGAGAFGQVYRVSLPSAYPPRICPVLPVAPVQNLRPAFALGFSLVRRPLFTVSARCRQIGGVGMWPSRCSSTNTRTAMTAT
jgi:hypothetical protein